MCGLGRLALVDTCTNCGLVLKVKPRAVAVRKTTGPEARRGRGRVSELTMAVLSSDLFSLGVILVALGFAAHVGHAVMLANGRRLVSLRAGAPARLRGRRDRLVRRRAGPLGVDRPRHLSPRRARCRARRSG